LYATGVALAVLSGALPFTLVMKVLRARFPKREGPLPPRRWVERGYNIQHWTEMPRGGHFPALEEPELLAEDIRLFFRAVRSE
jgi:pimeloyl-ACP methyl ester carboxylesterase